MSFTIITHPQGKVIIGPLEASGKSLPPTGGFEHQRGKITLISSTDAQPWVAANYNKAGEFIGGRTMSDSYRNAVITRSREAGATITEVSALPSKGSGGGGGDGGAKGR